MTTSHFLAGLLARAVFFGTPLLYAALGETLGERAGVVNLGLEGLLLVGASVSLAVGAATGDPWIGLGAAAFAGGLTNLIFAWLVVARRANQLASGLSMMFLGFGVSALVGARAGLVPWMPRLLGHEILTWLSVPTAVLVWWLLFRTRWGLRVRTVGESPAVAFAAGANPALLQFQALGAGGVLAGLAGGHFALTIAHSWSEYMTGGLGFIAIALVIFSKWDPLRAVAGALLMGAAQGLVFELQTRGVQISPFVLQMFPYLLTLLVLRAWGGSRRLAAPASLGRTFFGLE
jgi:simple sugar transport system permease protein